MPASRMTGTSTDWRSRRDVVWVPNAETAPDRRTKGHHRGTTDLLEAEGQDRVVGRVGQDHKSVLGELFGRLQQLHGVGQQRAIVPDDLELDPVGAEGLAGQFGREHRLRRGGTAGSVREDPDAEFVEEGEQRALARRLHPSHRHGGEVRARFLECGAQGVEAGHAARAEQQPGRQHLPGDAEGIWHIGAGQIGRAAVSSPERPYFHARLSWPGCRRSTRRRPR